MKTVSEFSKVTEYKANIQINVLNKCPCNSNENQIMKYNMYMLKKNEYMYTPGHVKECSNI